MKMLSVLGIKIVPKIVNNPKKFFSIFDMLVAEGSPADPLFYSSPRLRQILSQFAIGTNIGNIQYSGFRSAGEFFLTGYIYPFGVFDPIKEFIGKGIGSELERKCLTELRKHVGNAPIRLTSSTNLREQQFAERRTKKGRMTLAQALSSINWLRKIKRKEFRRK